MDVTIANLHITVHRALDTQRPALTVTRVEQEAQRSKQIQRVERERQQALDWYALHGGH